MLCGTSTLTEERANASRAPAVLRSARLSLAMQIFFALVTAVPLFFPLWDPNNPERYDSELFAIVLLETMSQVIEFTYYVTVLFWVGAIYTWTRYLDWFVSTPVMLVSIMGFLTYVEDRDNGSIARIFEPDRLGYTLGVLGFNLLMLIFGFLVETGRTEYVQSTLILGMVSFFASFATLFSGFVFGTGPIGIGLFLFVYLVWGGYGIAATQDEVTKNVAYNGLDVLSKNFYGLFLFVYSLAMFNGL